MQLEELTSYSFVDIQDLDALMHELSPTSYCSEEILSRIITDNNAHLYIIRNESHIIACACLCIAHTPEFTLGFIESVTVKSEYRGNHLGKQLMEHVIKEATRLGVQRLHLTSSPNRVAANALYQSLGFERHDTNCYQMKL